MASTHNLRPTNSVYKFDATQGKKVVLDLSTVSQNVAQDETVSLFDLPAGVIVSGAMLKVTTAQATVTDVDLGISTDGSTADDLIDGATLATTGYKAGETTEVPVVADSQIVFTNKDADTAATAVMKVIFFVKDMRA